MATQKKAISDIEKLFQQAQDVFSKNPKLADKYIIKARRIGEKARTPIPAKLKKRFCRNCDSFWMPGKNVRVRLQQRKVVYSCLMCGSFTRHPYVKEQKAKRARSK